MNVVGSTIGRETDAGIYLHAGPEIGVASTKAFTAQVMVFSMLSILIGYKKGRMNKQQYENHVKSLSQSPAQSAHILNNTSSVLEASKVYRYAQHNLFFGRGFRTFSALRVVETEGNFPLRRGYARQLKLIRSGRSITMPVVFVAPKSDSV